MLRLFAMLSLAGMSLCATACHKQPEGAAKIVVIGGTPALRDPEDGALTAPDAVLLQNVGQGLVSFDANGNIVGGLAERWNVSDDGLSYIFRLATTKWPDGHKITAQQVAKLLKREIGSHSKNPYQDALGAIDDIVAMTDRVIEIRLTAPRPNLLAVLAQPELGIVRNGLGTGPYSIDPKSPAPGTLRLVRDVLSSDEISDPQGRDPGKRRRRPLPRSIVSLPANPTLFWAALSPTCRTCKASNFSAIRCALIRRRVCLAWYRLAPVPYFDNADLRRLLSQSINRDGLVAALGVPGLAPRATVLEAGLDGMAPPSPPPGWVCRWMHGVPLCSPRQRVCLEASPSRRSICCCPRALAPKSFFASFRSDWGALGFTVDRAISGSDADLRLIDAVAPSTSPAWFVREFALRNSLRLRSGSGPADGCGAIGVDFAATLCADRQAAAKIDDQQLFIPLAAPVRWSLVSSRIQGFAGNRFAVHTLTNLMSKPAGD